LPLDLLDQLNSLVIKCRLALVCLIIEINLHA
jgi:hypothetical protein